MRHIPLLGEQGAEREPDRAKPQKWLRHQENAAKPQKRRRRARSASAIARSRLVVSSADLRRRAELTTPSATDLNGSIVFDVADTPPLRGGECAAPKTLSKKLKVAALLHKRADEKAQKSGFLCRLVILILPFVVRSAFVGQRIMHPCSVRDAGLRCPCDPQISSDYLDDLLFHRDNMACRTSATRTCTVYVRTAGQPNRRAGARPVHLRVSGKQASPSEGIRPGARVYAVSRRWKLDQIGLPSPAEAR